MNIRQRPSAFARMLQVGLGLLVCLSLLAAVEPSPLAKKKSGRAAPNKRLVTTGIRSLPLPSNHALLISVSAYPSSPLPGVLKDREIARNLALRFGVPPENITSLSEQEVTRENLQQALAQLDKKVMPGDKLYIYFSGHGARFFEKGAGQCTESIVMHDLSLVTNEEFAELVKPLSAKTDKTVVMLDSCHSGGLAAAGTRSIKARGNRPKFDAAASSAECAKPTNVRSFSQARGIEFDTTDNNLVILAAARNNEVAWDTQQGGAMTFNFDQCATGKVVDSDLSGSISMQELTDCVQGRLDAAQDSAVLQHLTLTGNGSLVPGFSEELPPAPGPAPAPEPPEDLGVLGVLKDIYAMRDDRWRVTAKLDKAVLKIGKDTLDFAVGSDRDGFVYIFYAGSGPGSFYLLFPNQLDAENTIKANEVLKLPRPAWTVNALGPAGTDHLLVIVTETAREFSGLSLPPEYVSAAGPFAKVRATRRAAAHINRIATLSAAQKSPECQARNRDLGVARRCSNAFGAELLSVTEE